MEAPELPCDGDHDFDQGGRCTECGIDRVDTTADGWENRRSGGAGSLTQPLTNGQYKRQVEKLGR